VCPTDGGLLLVMLLLLVRYYFTLRSSNEQQVAVHKDPVTPNAFGLLCIVSRTARAWLHWQPILLMEGRNPVLTLCAGKMKKNDTCKTLTCINRQRRTENVCGSFSAMREKIQ